MIKNDQSYWYEYKIFRLSGNGFMHPSLPPGYGRRWKEMQRTQEMTTRKNKNKQNTHRSKSKKKQNLNTQPVMEKISSNKQSKQSYIMRNSLRESHGNTKVVTDDVLRSFGVLASDYSVSVTTNKFNNNLYSLPHLLQKFY